MIKAGLRRGAEIGLGALGGGEAKRDHVKEKKGKDTEELSDGGCGIKEE